MTQNVRRPWPPFPTVRGRRFKSEHRMWRCSEAGPPRALAERGTALGDESPLRVERIARRGPNDEYTPKGGARRRQTMQSGRWMVFLKLDPAPA